MAYRPRTRWLLIFGLCLGTVMPVAAAENACHDALVVDQWQPFVALTRHGNASDALADLGRVIAVQRLIVGHAEPDAAARKLRGALWKGVRDYDLDALYEALPVADPPWRAAYFISRPAGDIYRLSVADGPDATIDSLGAIRTTLAAKPDEKADRGDAFTVRGALGANIGPIGWQGAYEAAGLGILHSAQPANISAPGPAQQAANGAFGELAKDDRPLMAQLWHGLPATWAWYARIGRVEQLRGVPATAGGVHHLHYQAALDASELADAYPAVDDYMAQLADLVEARIRVTSAAGQWLVFTVDSGARQISVDAWVDDDGHLVPSADGAPRPDQALGDTPARGDFSTDINARMRAYGMVIAFDDLTIDWHFTADASGGHLVGRLDDVPVTRTSGRAFGIVPTGMLDALMPKDLASFAEQFMQRLADSDDGAGARLALDLTDRSTDNRLVFEGEGDLLDNFFVRFGVKLMNGRVLPSGEQLAGLRRLLDDGLGAFEADRLRRAGIGRVDTACHLR